MKENNERFFIDIIDKGKENCNKIKDKIMKLVAYPDRQEINLYDDGLEGYLNKT